MEFCDNTMGSNIISNRTRDVLLKDYRLVGGAAMTVNLTHEGTDLGLGWGSLHGRYRNVEFANLRCFGAAFSTVEKLKLVGVVADWEFQKFVRAICSVPVGRLVETPSIETAMQSVWGGNWNCSQHPGSLTQLMN